MIFRCVAANLALSQLAAHILYLCGRWIVHMPNEKCTCVVHVYINRSTVFFQFHSLPLRSQKENQQFVSMFIFRPALVVLVECAPSLSYVLSALAPSQEHNFQLFFCFLSAQLGRSPMSCKIFFFLLFVQDDGPRFSTRIHSDSQSVASRLSRIRMQYPNGREEKMKNKHIIQFKSVLAISPKTDENEPEKTKDVEKQNVEMQQDRATMTMTTGENDINVVWCVHTAHDSFMCGLNLFDMTANTKLSDGRALPIRFFFRFFRSNMFSCAFRCGWARARTYSAGETKRNEKCIVVFLSAHYCCLVVRSIKFGESNEISANFVWSFRLPMPPSSLFVALDLNLRCALRLSSRNEKRKNEKVNQRFGATEQTAPRDDAETRGRSSRKWEKKNGTFVKYSYLNIC